MELELVNRYTSTLPAADNHPYRTGAWRPNSREHNATQLPVWGRLPQDLDGVYLRNTENPRFESQMMYHPFDGDGMVHAINFQGGRASYRNRFVRTQGFMCETAAQASLSLGLLEGADLSARPGLRPGGMKDASSTDIVVHNGVALTTFYLCGEAYQLDPVSLEQSGPAQWGGGFPKDLGISAHAQVDERAGELLFFNYGMQAPYMHYGVVDAQGRLAHQTAVPLPGPRFPHDMAFTENYVVLNDLPVFWNPRHLPNNIYKPRFFPELPSRFAVLPRRGSAQDIRWFEAPPTYVLHFANAFEQGDEVVLEGFPQEVPMTEINVPGDLLATFKSRLDIHAMRTRLSRWRFNLKTGSTRVEQLSAAISEFPSIHNAYRGRANRYTYCMLGEPGWFLFNGLLKHDNATGEETRYLFPKGVFASETPFAPRSGGSGEDDGYLVTYVTDMNADSSACWVFAAQDLAAGPIAKVGLPERISSGTHAYFAPRAALRRSAVF